MGLPSRSALAQLLSQGCCTGLCKEMLAGKSRPAQDLSVTSARALSALSPCFGWGSPGEVQGARHAWSVWGALCGTVALRGGCSLGASRDGSGAGQQQPKNAGIDCFAKASLAAALWGRSSAGRSSEELAWRGAAVL